MLKHKYIVNNYKNIIINKKNFESINNFNNYLPQNIIIYGYNGSGKNTFLNILLHKLFNNIKYKNIYKEYNNLHFYYKFNITHIIIDFSFYINKESIIIKYFLNDYVKSKNVLNDNDKLIIIKNFNNISIINQKLLINLIDKYYFNFKLILITNDINNIYDGLLDRTININIKSPDINDINIYINNIIIKEDIELNDIIKNKIINQSYNLNNKTLNINKILNNLELYTIDKNLIINNNNNDLSNIFNKIIKFIKKKKINNNDINKLRELLYNLYEYNISNNNIFRMIKNKIIDNCELNDNNKYILINLLADKNILINKGNNSIYFLENLLLEINNII